MYFASSLASQVPFPSCFYADDQSGILVLEDLSLGGFSLVPAAPDGLDQAHAEAALDALAKLHAFGRKIVVKEGVGFSSKYGAIGEVAKWGAFSTQDEDVIEESRWKIT